MWQGYGRGNDDQARQRNKDSGIARDAMTEVYKVDYEAFILRESRSQNGDPAHYRISQSVHK